MLTFFMIEGNRVATGRVWVRHVQPELTGRVKRFNPREARENFESLAFELNPRVESVCLGPTRESDSLVLDPNLSRDESELKILRLRVMGRVESFGLRLMRWCSRKTHFTLSRDHLTSSKFRPSWILRGICQGWWLWEQCWAWNLKSWGTCIWPPFSMCIRQWLMTDPATP